MIGRRARAWMGLCLLAQSACSLEPARARGAASLRLMAADADVWAAHAELRAQLTAADGYACSVLAGERRYPARVDAQGTVTADVPLSAGDNPLRVRCEATGQAPLAAGPVHYRVPLTAAPHAVARLRTSGARAELDASESQPSELSAVPLTRYDWSARLSDGRELPLGEGVRLPIERSGPPGLRRYELRVRDALGRTDLAAVSGDATLSDRAAQAVVYGVLPPVFGEPPLRAVTAALDELAALGITTLWLSPLFTPTARDYGYAVRDYFALRPDFGSAAELRALIDRAHALGLSVLLDLPANDTATQHPYFVQANELGARSHYFPFYVRDDMGEPTHYFDWQNLPNLAYDQPEVARFMLEVARHWIDGYGVDGYRIDAAWGVRVRSPGYWPRFVAELRRVHPELWLIAEAPARDPYYGRELFTAAYDWTDQLGEHSWAHVFDAPQGIAQRLAASVQASPHMPRVLRFLNNNDTGARFITRHGVALTRVATALLLTLPGIPCLFSRDEQGAAFEPYALRGPVTGPGDPALRALHAQLIRLRRSHPALYGEGYRVLHASPADEALVYLREGGGEQLIVALNFGPRPVSVRLAPAPFQRALDLLGRRSSELQQGLQLSGWDMQVLRPQ